MKSTFPHYLPRTIEHDEALWASAVFVYDANVLLDLYRFHADVAEAMLSAMEGLPDRNWLPHQAALEFFRNREAVIEASGRAFEEARAVLRKLKEMAVQNRSVMRRAIPPNDLDAIIREIEGAVGKGLDVVDTEEGNHPDYVQNDVILERLLQIFDGRVGAEPTDAERELLTKQAKKRFDAKVPPGFEDKGKGGERQYGDYFLWNQVLEHAREASVDIVLVTAEQKGDWWEKRGGQRKGMRREMIEEAARVTGGRTVVLVSPDRFLERISKLEGRTLAGFVLTELKILQAKRGGTEQDKLDDIVQEHLWDYLDQLPDSDEAIAGRVAETNCHSFSLAEFSVKSAGPLNLDDVSLPFVVEARYEGEHDVDHMFSGDTIEAEIEGSLVYDGGSWDVVDHKVISSDVRYPEPDDDDR